MAGGPFPSGWFHKQVSIELTRGSGLPGRVIGSDEGGCIVERELPEGDGSTTITRKVFYPWTSILSIMLLEEPDQSGTNSPPRSWGARPG